MPEPEYFLTVSERSWISDPGEDSDDRYAYRGHSECEATLRTLSLTKPNPEDAYYNYERIADDAYGIYYPPVREVPAEGTAYVILVHYTDGDTFGSSGYWCVPALVDTQERAREIVEAIQGPQEADKLTRSRWRPWDGYFAGLSSVEVHEMVVQP